MARKPRIEFEGAVYHVLNRGNYRSDLFETAEAARAFIDCLFAACEKSGWFLHAYAIMRNHYHLAIETPRGNLVTGVHWLQSAFGNRYNRFRGERGRAFQGRYQAILVEPGVHLRQLVDFIHLNPVRAGIVPLTLLAQFRWSSYRHFVRGAAGRHPAFKCEPWLSVLDGLADTPEGWRSYHDHLAWLMADARRQTAAAFDQLSRGWAHGSEAYRQVLARDFKQMSLARDWGGAKLAERNRQDWDRRLTMGLQALRHTLAEARRAPKSTPWKVALAAWVKRGCTASNRWLSEQLKMGPPDAVSRYVGELARGNRTEAGALFDELTAKIPG